MSDIRLTEERLRSYLDTNQFKRESLCVAVLPFLGSYTQVKSRRPKGGPDGRRDIEAVFDNQYTIWGGVGFRNGGGNDDAARKEAKNKYRSDLKSALKEKEDLTHFVFFTNVDLTPGQITKLKQYAEKKGITHTEIFDLNRLRAILDSPEGLIARLQYLDIEMSKTEQVALINKFGDELQTAFTSRIDRVDETLSRMELFLDFQKPITKTLFLVELHEECCEDDIVGEALCFEIEGMSLVGDGKRRIEKHLIFADAATADSKNTFRSVAFDWHEDNGNITGRRQNIVGHKVIIADANTFGTSFEGIQYTNPFGIRTLSKIIDLKVRVLATQELAKLIARIQIIANGYTLLDEEPITSEKMETLTLPEELICPEGFEVPCKQLQLQLILPNTYQSFIQKPPQKWVTTSE